MRLDHRQLTPNALLINLTNKIATAGEYLVIASSLFAKGVILGWVMFAGRSSWFSCDRVHDRFFLPMSNRRML